MQQACMLWCRFDFPSFWPEARRILKPSGAVAAWGYDIPTFPDHKACTELMSDWYQASAPGCGAEPDTGVTRLNRRRLQLAAACKELSRSLCSFMYVQLFAVIGCREKPGVTGVTADNIWMTIIEVFKALLCMCDRALLGCDWSATYCFLYKGLGITYAGEDLC